MNKKKEKLVLSKGSEVTTRQVEEADCNFFISFDDKLEVINKIELDQDGQVVSK